MADPVKLTERPLLALPVIVTTWLGEAPTETPETATETVTCAPVEKGLPAEDTAAPPSPCGADTSEASTLRASPFKVVTATTALDPEPVMLVTEPCTVIVLPKYRGILSPLPVEL